MKEQKVHQKVSNQAADKRNHQIVIFFYPNHSQLIGLKTRKMLEEDFSQTVDYGDVYHSMN